MKKTPTVKVADSHYPIIDIIKERYSPRIFSNEAISDAELMTLFEAARWAPSSNNLQPWRFIYARIGSEDWDRMYQHLAPFNQGWVGNASVMLLTAIRTHANGKEQYHALHDLGLSVANMTLQAQSMGIALHQMAGLDHTSAAKDYNIPDKYHFATAIAIGKYGGDVSDLDDEDLREGETAPRERKRLEEIVNHGDWSTTF